MECSRCRFTPSKHALLGWGKAGNDGERVDALVLRMGMKVLLEKPVVDTNTSFCTPQDEDNAYDRTKAMNLSLFGTEMTEA